MALALSLTAGIGVLLVYLSATRRPQEPRPAAGRAMLAAVDDLLRRAGLSGVRPGHFLLFSAAVGIGAAAATELLLGWPAVSLAALPIGALLPAWYLRTRAEARRAALEGTLADAVDALRASVRAGMSIEEGLAGLARNGPEPLRPTFRALTRDLRLADFAEAVRRAQDDLADPVFDTVAAALLMAHQVGGRNLSPVLESLGRAVRGAARAEREARAQQARNVLSARVIAALPLALIAAIRALNPDYLAAFASPAGQALLAVCLVSVAVGYAAMLRAARLPVAERKQSR